MTSKAPHDFREQALACWAHRGLHSHGGPSAPQAGREEAAAGGRALLPAVCSGPAALEVGARCSRPWQSQGAPPGPSGHTSRALPQAEGLAGRSPPTHTPEVSCPEVNPRPQLGSSSWRAGPEGREAGGPLEGQECLSRGQRLHRMGERPEFREAARPDPALSPQAGPTPLAAAAARWPGTCTPGAGRTGPPPPPASPPALPPTAGPPPRAPSLTPALPPTAGPCSAA